ncbi:MAG: SAM-dependent methyltransferase [Hyphomicrobiaceae bacterium]|jgi:SAM-dependent methyltransferase
MSQGSDIFDRELLHARRARQVSRLDRDALPDFLLKHAAEDVVDRLAMIKRRFERAVSVGSYHGVMARMLREAGVSDVVETDPVAELLALGNAGEMAVVADEAFSQLATGTFDLAVSVLALQYANDLPGVLAQIHKLLKPDGLFIGVVLGGATLGELRQVMLAAEAEVTGGASPRVMPFVDVRDAGGLLQRAGFALPVADAETLTVTYASALDLMRELKAMGATNVLHERSRVPATRGLLLRAAEIYAERFPAADGEGRIAVTFELVTLTGWSPDPSQQKPLKPGSAQVSLTEVLKPRG